MPLEALLAQVRAEAEAETDRLVAEARTEASAIREAATDDADARIAAGLLAHERQARATLAAEAAVLDAAVRRGELAASTDVAGRVLARAEAGLASLDLVRYREALARLLAEAHACLGEGLTLRAAPSTAVALRATGPPDLIVHEEPGTPAGFLAESRDGCLRVDATWPALLRARAPAFRSWIAARVRQGGL